MAYLMDYIQIFDELNKEEIEYLVVGGLALNLLGIPRATYDIDLLLELSSHNLIKFLSLVKKWGFKPKVPVSIMDFAEKEKRDGWIKKKNMKAFCLVNPDWALSEIDIIIDTPVTYNLAAKDAKHIKIGTAPAVSVPVISVNNLIKMKQKTARQQDKADIRYLRKLQDV
ncbi:MAG: hypothetical protein HY919_04205 [Elusimicrobia bacterium]|nr:hypothetical protein [Elusimicrobiota bacterium]